jgi:hypothetical protein
MDVYAISKYLDTFLKYLLYFFVGTVILAIFSYSLLLIRSKLQKIKEDYESEKQKVLEEELQEEKSTKKIK